MKFIYVSLFVSAFSSSLFGTSNLDKIKEEGAIQTQHIPVSEENEIKIYRHLKHSLFDFQSLEILEWGPRFSKKSLTSKEGEWYIALKIRALTSVGNRAISVQVFRFAGNEIISSVTLDASTNLWHPFSSGFTRTIHLADEARKDRPAPPQTKYLKTP